MSDCNDVMGRWEDINDRIYRYADYHTKDDLASVQNFVTAVRQWIMLAPQVSSHGGPSAEEIRHDLVTKKEMLDDALMEEAHRKRQTRGGGGFVYRNMTRSGRRRDSYVVKPQES